MSATRTLQGIGCDMLEASTYQNPTAGADNARYVEQLLEKAYEEFENAVNGRGKVDLVAEMKKLRERGPVVFGDGCRFGDFDLPPSWSIEGVPTAMVMDYRGVTQVLLEGNDFAHAFYPQAGEPTLIHLNGEPHRRYRKLLAPVFSPKAIKFWETNLVPGVLDELMARLAGKRTENLVQALARPYPAMVFRSIMGLPKADTDMVRALAIITIAAGADPKLDQYIRDVDSYFQRLIEGRRAATAADAAPSGDIVSLLLATRADGDALSDEEVRSTLALFIQAGADTTHHGLANTLFMLLTRPDVLSEVKANRSLIPAAIEEALRLVPAGAAFEVRQALRDVEVSGVTIPKGMPVVTCEVTANRDPTVWDRPDEFDIHRERKQHLTFATGPHTCIGLHLARMEIRAAVNALFDRYPNVRLDTSQPPPVITGVLAMSPTDLPVILQ